VSMRSQWCRAAASGLVLTSMASGDVVFRFAFDQPEYTVIRSETVSVPLYLEEAVTGTDTSLLLSENGLFSAAVRLSRISSTGNTPSSIVGAAAVQPNTVEFFDSGDPIFGPEITADAGGAQARLLEFARDAGVTGTTVQPGRRRVLLGRFIITAGARANQSSTFRAGDSDAGSSDTVTWTNQIVLDGADLGIAAADVVVTSIRGSCGIADFNNDGDVGTDLDIEAFFSCLAGDCCLDCESADFDGDGDTGTDLDIETFVRVLGGGTC